MKGDATHSPRDAETPSGPTLGVASPVSCAPRFWYPSSPSALEAAPSSSRASQASIPRFVQCRAPPSAPAAVAHPLHTLLLCPAWPLSNPERPVRTTNRRLEATPLASRTAYAAPSFPNRPELDELHSPANLRPLLPRSRAVGIANSRATPRHRIGVARGRARRVGGDVDSECHWGGRGWVAEVPLVLCRSRPEARAKCIPAERSGATCCDAPERGRG